MLALAQLSRDVTNYTPRRKNYLADDRVARRPLDGGISPHGSRRFVGNVEAFSRTKDLALGSPDVAGMDRLEHGGDADEAEERDRPRRILRAAARLTKAGSNAYGVEAPSRPSEPRVCAAYAGATERASRAVFPASSRLPAASYALARATKVVAL